MDRFRRRYAAPLRKGEDDRCHASAISGTPCQYRSIFRCASIVLVATVITGCHGVNPAELDFTRAEPSRSDVVGKWIPKSLRSKEARGRSVSMQQLNLGEDGTFSVIDLPTSPDVGGASSKGLLSGSGTWRLDKDENGFSIWVINLDFMNHHRETVHLRRQTPPYVIHGLVPKIETNS